MPEFPEVETIREQLSKKIIGKKIGRRKIANLRRRGKILIIDFSDKTSLIFHLKLTGQLIFNGKPSKKTRKVFYFNDGTRLIFNDLRKFGWYKFVKNTNKIEKELGLEALEIDLKRFKIILKKRPNSKIKSLLTDQKLIAGIGNIYANEILFASKIHPLREIKTLADEEIKKIHQKIKVILKKAVKLYGSSTQDYLDAYGQKGDYARYHKVYQKENQKCPHCSSGAIKRIKTAGRSAYFCSNCQI